jgi:hypothetical protein
MGMSEWLPLKKSEVSRGCVGNDGRPSDASDVRLEALPIFLWPPASTHVYPCRFYPRRWIWSELTHRWWPLVLPLIRWSLQETGVARYVDI